MLDSLIKDTYPLQLSTQTQSEATDCRTKSRTLHKQEFTKKYSFKFHLTLDSKVR